MGVILISDTIGILVHELYEHYEATCLLLFQVILVRRCTAPAPPNLRCILKLARRNPRKKKLFLG